MKTFILLQLILLLLAVAAATNAPHLDGFSKSNLRNSRIGQQCHPNKQNCKFCSNLYYCSECVQDADNCCFHPSLNGHIQGISDNAVFLINKFCTRPLPPLKTITEHCTMQIHLNPYQHSSAIANAQNVDQQFFVEDSINVSSSDEDDEDDHDDDDDDDNDDFESSFKVFNAEDVVTTTPSILTSTATAKNTQKTSTLAIMPAVVKDDAQKTTSTISAVTGRTLDAETTPMTSTVSGIASSTPNIGTTTLRPSTGFTQKTTSSIAAVNGRALDAETTSIMTSTITSDAQDVNFSSSTRNIETTTVLPSTGSTQQTSAIAVVTGRALDSETTPIMTSTMDATSTVSGITTVLPSIGSTQEPTSSVAAGTTVIMTSAEKPTSPVSTGETTLMASSTGTTQDSETTSTFMSSTSVTQTTAVSGSVPDVTVPEMSSVTQNSELSTTGVAQDVETTWTLGTVSSTVSQMIGMSSSTEVPVNPSIMSTVEDTDITTTAATTTTTTTTTTITTVGSQRQTSMADDGFTSESTITVAPEASMSTTTTAESDGVGETESIKLPKVQSVEIANHCKICKMSNMPQKCMKCMLDHKLCCFGLDTGVLAQEKLQYAAAKSFCFM